MLEKYKYTDTEIKKILSSIVILHDSREQRNEHILEWFDKKKIQHKEQKLNFGDYSFYLPKNEGLSINRDIYYDKEICIERKANLDELSNNFANERDRIEDELLRHKGKMTILIENGSYKDMCESKYKSQYNSKSFIATLHSFSDRYNVPFIFLDKEYSGQFIYCNFYYYLRNYMK